MKKIFAVLIILFLFFSVSAAPVYSAEKNEKKSEITSAKNLYRELKQRFSKDRAYYKNLSDEGFANFREINTTGIGKGILYRSSSPINDWGNRHLTADNLSRRAKIKTFVNLVDDYKKMTGYKNFSQTYYSTQRAAAFNFDLKFMSKDFQNKLARAVKFIADNEPPYLIHCNLGKDRTGLVCAVIEAVTGASSEEIAEDFMLSFYNYFSVMPGSKEYEFIVSHEIRSFLASMLGVENIDDVNLYLAAEKYLLKIGVASEDIEKVRKKLGGE
ncbi:MAG: tyrosine-protein phosphatase [Synergistales bacterium]|nr:tyrosine-protein phosphatase [Synergistales bacterium]MDY6402350.1 tyrosine-protein phosphatase [Synergistales bacterium]MDY6404475.1 tyrosine-protein phosphatase [Synergistales bacterium]MDY6410547.1 tyrosine-protein phosphatase [Synergistales bacterium]MDY6413783.1 tyrosine-protein phosphatase [Synergistales bacterium]